MSAPTTSVHFHACPLCEAGCGLEIGVTAGAVSLIRGDRDDVASHGFLCPKGVALKDLQTDPDRLRRPLIKRDGVFVEASFDEAFAEIERRLVPIRDQFGPLSCGLVIGNPTVHRTGLVLYILDVATALGSPNVFSAATLDQMPKHLAVGKMFGDFYSVPVPDIDRTDLLVVIGANPMVSNGSMWSVPNFRGRARAMQARGGRLITIDPRRTETAELADLHLPIRPGSDAFLLAAVVNTLFAERLIRLGRLEQYVDDLAPLRETVAIYTPEAVAHRCGIAAVDIRALARQIASTPKAAVYGRLGTCVQPHGTITSWLIDVVNTLTGHLDEPGGAMFATPPAFAGNATGAPGVGVGVGVATGTYRSRVSAAPEVMNQFPMACLAEEIDTPGEGQIRALVMVASNAALSVPESARLAKALEQLDFLVCFDIYLNETTRHADVIIPGPSPLEESHYDVFFSQYASRNTARFSTPSLAKPDDVLEDWEQMVRLVGILEGRDAATPIDVIDHDLTVRMLGSLPAEQIEGIIAAVGDRRGPERRLDMALRTGPYGDQFGLNPEGISLATLEATPHGLDLGPLRSRIPDMLRTASGMIELCPPEFLAELRHAATELDDPIPDCVMIGRRHLRSNNSWLHNLPLLAKGRERCTLLVHPDDANRWGLVDGGLADVTSEATGGCITATVEFDDSMLGGVVSLPHGWGHDQSGTALSVAAQRSGQNLNALTDARRRDVLSGNAVLNGTPVRIRPAPPF